MPCRCCKLRRAWRSSGGRTLPLPLFAIFHPLYFSSNRCSVRNRLSLGLRLSFPVWCRIKYFALGRLRTTTSHHGWCGAFPHLDRMARFPYLACVARFLTLAGWPVFWPWLDGPFSDPGWTARFLTMAGWPVFWPWLDGPFSYLGRMARFILPSKHRYCSSPVDKS